MQAPPILGGDRADATGADLLRLRAEASGSAADALGRLRRSPLCGVADLLHTALDGSTTPESFANIVAARGARPTSNSSSRSRSRCARPARWWRRARRRRRAAARRRGAGGVAGGRAAGGRRRARPAARGDCALRRGGGVLRDKLAFHARFDGGAEEEPMAADDAPTAAQLRLAVGHERAHAAHLALRAALDGERAEARQKRQMHVTRFAGRWRLPRASAPSAATRRTGAPPRAKTRRGGPPARRRGAWTAAHARRRSLEAALADARRRAAAAEAAAAEAEARADAAADACSASRRRWRRRATRSRAAAFASR